MRFVACALSAVLLSGCSWMGFGGQNRGHYTASNQYGVRYAQSKHNAAYGLRPQMGPCQITAPTQPIPRGCRAEQVTLALVQTQPAAQYGQYTTGAYGSQVGASEQKPSYSAGGPKLRKPKLRASFGLEIDHSVSGTLYDPGLSANVLAYDRNLYAEGTATGSVGSGQVVSTVYTSVPERIAAPTISYDDVYTAPLKISGGLEFIMGKHATVFANAGYVRAEGKKGGGVQIIDELRRITTTTDYNTDPANGPVGQLIGQSQSVSFIPNETVATFDYDFSDMERFDLEVGGRYYFNPILTESMDRTLTPFVSASGGASYYNKVSVSENQRQRFMTSAFEQRTNDFYDVSFGTPQEIYDSQWVPYGSLKAGVEWQMTPRTAIAFETGVKYEGARDFSNGTKSDENISIPFGIRGSYNF
ncbi:MAG TPA: hypothetical protein ENJ42_04850 [Hellea balneolensis]|uniref:DUF3570 domain-containing protein n=1 Tax=Hellea balneolensis TaxID=287478 RepID=A0A7C5R445_9PROT|nr:hypothetical protein [Hellea balneolensis]